MTGIFFNKDEKETEKDEFKVKTSEIGLDSIFVGDIYHHTHSFSQIGLVKPIS